MIACEEKYCRTCRKHMEHYQEIRVSAAWICENDHGPCDRCHASMHGPEAAHVTEDGQRLICTECLIGGHDD
jgi:hypothetical protein